MTDIEHVIAPAEKLPTLSEALSAAQGEFPPIPRDRKVTVKGKTREGKPFEYEYSYAPLDTILAAVRPVLAKHGLAISQVIEDIGAGLCLRTVLMHKAGGRMQGSFPLLSTPENPQALGSMLTYLRRYALVAMLGLAAEEDDDAQSAESAPKPTPAEDKPEMIQPAQMRNIGRLLGELDKKAPIPEGQGQLSWVAQLRERFKVRTRKDLTKAQASEAIKWLEKTLADADFPA